MQIIHLYYQVILPAHHFGVFEVILNVLRHGCYGIKLLIHVHEPLLDVSTCSFSVSSNHFISRGTAKTDTTRDRLQNKAPRKGEIMAV